MVTEGVARRERLRLYFEGVRKNNLRGPTLDLYIACVCICIIILSLCMIFSKILLAKLMAGVAVYVRSDRIYLEESGFSAPSFHKKIDKNPDKGRQTDS